MSYGGKFLRRMGKTATSCLTLLAVSWFLLVAPEVGADTAEYFYDDLGRLERVVRGTEGVAYRYDQLGNLLSVSAGTTAIAPPVISSISPNVLFVGSKMLVVIAGQNLLTSESVAALGGLVDIGSVTVTDTRITAEMTALAAGAETIQVTTRYGTPNTAGVGLSLSSSTLSFIPGQLAVVPGSSGTIRAEISPSIDVPLTLNLSSSSPSVATVPPTLTIPVSGSADITVNGLQEGVSTVNAGEVRSVVFVSPPFSGDVSGLKSGNVSVYIDAPQQGIFPASARPVSVYYDAPSEGSSSSQARPVSVYVDISQEATSTSSSKSVSVYVDASADNSSTTTARPVSVEIQ